MDHQIKQANIDYFKKVQAGNEHFERVLVEHCKKMKGIIGDYTETIAQACDPTNESIPFTVTKLGDNKYKFRRVLSRKLKFKSIHDINEFFDIYHTTVLLVCSGVKLPLDFPGMKITNIRLEHDIGIDPVSSYKDMFLVSLTLFGIIFAGVGLYDRFKKESKNREGFEFVLSWTFETLDHGVVQSKSLPGQDTKDNN